MNPAAGWNSSRQDAGAGPKYPNFGLARRLELVAQMIKADFGTRIFYTSLDGFDTHANQLGTHRRCSMSSPIRSPHFMTT